jgi:hypothetical protein
VGQQRDSLRLNVTRLLRDTHADVAMLQEAERFNGTVPGYRRWAADEHPRPEAGMCVILYRKELRVVRRGLMVIEGPDWVGPKHGLRHPPRIFPWLALEDPEAGPAWYLLNVHRTWVGDEWRNLGSWTAEDHQLERWADRRMAGHPERPLGMFGDWNGSERDRHPLSVSSLARRTGTTPNLIGVDGGLVRAAKAHARRLTRSYTTERPAHHPVVTDLVAL